MELSEYIKIIKSDPEFSAAYIYHRYLPAKKAVYGPELNVPAEILRILEPLGIKKFYSHQIEAIQHIRNRENVLVSTPTASGKSLIYNLSFLEALLVNEKTKALYVFPLKALEQDQLKNLIILLKRIEGRKTSAHIYDGDTTSYRRK
ncbi:MAG: DEAD/DEAH box helicase, partial [Thermodesulfobacteriota bacterium]|nr:DEAD/DEAH box helicase [Thermodesulfobacteriota bacterium]